MRVKRIGAIVLLVGLLACSVAGNVYQSRHWIRAKVIAVLEIEETLPESVDRDTTGVGVSMGLLRAEIKKLREDAKREDAAIKELLEHYKKFAEDDRYELSQVRETCKQTDSSLQDLKTGMKGIRGELIRSGHLAKEWSTAF